MSRWYNQILKSGDDLSCVIDAVDFFEAQWVEAIAEISTDTLRGQRVEAIAKQLPGWAGYRLAQREELEAIVTYLELRETAVKGERRRHFIECYNRTLTATTAEKYVEADAAVISMAILRNQVQLLASKYQALAKQYEYLHYSIGNITRLLTAGVNDAIF